MSKTVIAIDPVTRLEGHLKVEVQVEDGKVADAWITGGMFRGFEAILRGRNPRDASQIVQRICGVCPVAHATASSLAIEAVCGVEVPENGRIARNLMLAGNYLQSNILHFYHLGGQDYFHGPDTVPFIPRYRNPDLRLSEEQNTLAMDEYIEALEVRQVCHQLVALFGGRMPHLQGILGGGAETFRQIGEDPAFSIMGRNVARVEEVYQTLGMIEYWLHELEPGAQTFALPEVPQAGEGIGFTEAPRGALCHYMRVKNGVIDDYAVVAASMWNCSPRDDAGKRGAVEEALIGVPVPEVDSPVNVGRVIRAYDP